MTNNRITAPKGANKASQRDAFSAPAGGVKSLMNIRELSRTGIIFTILYVLLCIVCVIWSLFITDPKGNYVILQIPVVLQHGALLGLGMTHLLSGMSWTSMYFFLGTPMILFIYYLGKFTEAIIRHAFKNMASGNNS
jgi:hypothetical protein